jgi:hypothetical protein
MLARRQVRNRATAHVVNNDRASASKDQREGANAFRAVFLHRTKINGIPFMHLENTE